MRKIRKTGVYLDYLHKGFVCTCIAASLYGASFITYGIYNYYFNIKPEMQKLVDAENRKLLSEGASDTLTDVAPTLQM